jgi:putative transposase
MARARWTTGPNAFPLGGKSRSLCVCYEVKTWSCIPENWRDCSSALEMANTIPDRWPGSTKKTPPGRLGPGGRPPSTAAEVEKVRRTTSPSTQNRYSLVRVCRVWRLGRSRVYWQRLPKPESAGAAVRPGPAGPCADYDLVQHVKAILAETPVHGEGYRKVWARLRYAGLRTSKRRVLRLMREYQLLAPHRRGCSPGPRIHDGTITTSRVNDMWGTDMASTFTTAEGQAAILFAVDHCSMECVGIHAAKRGTRFQALEPLRQGVSEYFRAFTSQAAQGLTLRHDHGSQYMSDDFQEEIAFL